MDTALYKTLADAYNDIRAEPFTADTSAKNARNDIVDLTSSGGGTQIEVDLLNTLNKAFLQVREFFQDEPRILDAVRAINNSAEGAYSGTLTEFVNSVPWNGGSVPFYWESLSADAGFDTDDWI